MDSKKDKTGTIVICYNVDKGYQEIDVEVTQWGHC